MSRRIQGFTKDQTKQRSGTWGYRPVWDMGKAGRVKKRQKLTGINRPSV